MALCDYRHCPAHGMNVPFTNGLCDGCRNEAVKVAKDSADYSWEAMSTDEKLDYLRSKIE